MNTRKGFTLIELMIVVSIISIICAIAIPNLLRSQVQANEAAAIEDLRAVSSAQISYNSSHATFTDLGGLADTSDGPAYLDSSWGEGRVKSGYVFTTTTSNKGTFVCIAEPVTQGRSGVRHFRVDATGVIRFNPSGAPSDSDPPVGGG